MEQEVVEPTQITPVTQSEVVKTNRDINNYIKLRQSFIKKVNAICVEGKDYHVIQGKKSLAKGGAEKIASIFKWTAKFDKDTESLDMLGNIVGLVAFKCTLTNGGVVGEGRGAALLAKNNGDPNKTLKMAQKSAFIDAVLRSSGLSDFFTQDLEDMPKGEVSVTPVKPQEDPITPAQFTLLCKLYGQKVGICTGEIKDEFEILTKHEASVKIGEYIKKPDLQHDEPSEDPNDPGDPNNEPPITDDYFKDIK